MAITCICTANLYDAKRVNLISNLSNIRGERHLEDLYSSGTCTGRYFQIISVYDEGPDEIFYQLFV